MKTFVVRAMLWQALHAQIALAQETPDWEGFLPAEFPATTPEAAVPDIPFEPPSGAAGIIAPPVEVGPAAESPDAIGAAGIGAAAGALLGVTAKLPLLPTIGVDVGGAAGALLGGLDGPTKTIDLLTAPTNFLAGLLADPLGILAAGDPSSSSSASASSSDSVVSSTDSATVSWTDSTVSATDSASITDSATDSATTDSATWSVTDTTDSSSSMPSEEEPTPTPTPESESAPIGWTGEDSSWYEGEDYGDDYGDDYKDGYEECPSYCYKKDGYDTDYKDDYEDDYEDDTDYGYVKRLLNRFRRRETGGFADFLWPSTGYKDSEECSDDVPEWLYESTKKPPCKPKCPKSCYESYPTKDEYGHDDYDPYKTKEPYPAETPYGDDPYAGSNSGDPSVMPTDGSEPTPTDGSEPTPMEPGEEVSTSTTTLTTFVTSVVTVPAPGDEGTAPAPTGDSAGSESSESAGDASPPAGPGASSNTGGADWTGNSLATVCPKQCDPFNPATNKCDITSSCTTTGKGKYYCACRAGFRASAWNEKDFSKQFKFKGQPYVYTAQGVVCDTVCSDQTCTEVLERPSCQ